MVKKTAVLALGTVLALSATPASAITTGVPDDGEHPYVGEIIFYDPDFVSSQFNDPGGWFSCSATMLSATVLVTAGHCTYGVGHDGESTTEGGGDGSGGDDIWFDNSEEAHLKGFPASSDYGPDENQQRYEDRAKFLDKSKFWHEATAYPHPEFADGPFYLHDAGVVVLDKALAVGTYGEISTRGYLDRYQGTPDHLFEVVGYGLTASGPFTEEGGDVRLKGLVKLNSLEGSSPKDTYILLSNNPGKPHPGGTCFGDSGGPTFDDTNSTLVVAVTSFGFSSTCSGVGGAYRLDQPDDLAFLRSFGIRP